MTMAAIGRQAPIDLKTFLNLGWGPPRSFRALLGGSILAVGPCNMARW